MSKKIAVINDLSGFGRCSLTAAISVLSAMGVQACPLPTAILTAQTGYPSYYCDDYTEKMERYRTEWLKMEQHFDGIYTGFVAGEKQIQQIFRFIDSFHTPDTFLLVDPVMGDNGNTYAMYTPALRREMHRLTLEADIITPNLTEFCLLADADYHRFSEDDTTLEHLDELTLLGQQYCKNGPQDIIITGIRFTDENQIKKMGNLHVNADGSFLSAFPYIGGSYSGTGDLFASCISAGVARGDSINKLMELAGAFLEKALADSVEEQIPRNDGVNYEKYLGMLIPNMNE